MSGLRDAEWVASDWRKPLTRQYDVGVSFRDRHGMAWRAVDQYSAELVEDAPAVVGELLAHGWERFKRYLERRFSIQQPWVFEGLNRRAREWKGRHEATVARWDGWTEEEIEEAGLEDWA
jgi:hypothetical protein